MWWKAVERALLPHPYRKSPISPQSTHLPSLTIPTYSSVAFLKSEIHSMFHHKCTSVYQLDAVTPHFFPNNNNGCLPRLRRPVEPAKLRRNCICINNPTSTPPLKTRKYHASAPFCDNRGWGTWDASSNTSLRPKSWEMRWDEKRVRDEMSRLGWDRDARLGWWCSVCAGVYCRRDGKPGRWFVFWRGFHCLADGEGWEAKVCK